MARITGLDKAEAARLREVVRQLESLLAPGGAQGGVAGSMLLHQMLESDRQRLLHLEELEAAALVDEREKSVRELALSVAAQRETALTAAERAQYTEFLGKEAFTKADFGKLEDFYRSAWDRLSEDGKAEMSQRIWEGVRRDEYEFSELPDIVKQKEAQYLYNQLRDGAERNPGLLRIPETDRADFLREWDTGNRSKTYEVLDRPSFSENVATKDSQQRVAHAVKLDTGTATPILNAESVERPKAAKEGTEFGGATLALPDIALVSAENSTQVPPLPGKPQSGKGK